MIAVPAGQVTLSDRRTQRSWAVELDPYQLAAHPHHPDAVRARNRRASKYRARGPSARRGRLLVGRGPILQRLVAARGVHTRLSAGRRRGHRTRHGGRRVPAATEAEWEHACRAGTAGPRYGLLDEIAWHRGNSAETTHEVGGKRPNLWGFHDMLGNVWEWCWDLYDAEVYGTYRVLRGGGWFDEHWSCRASVRRRSHPTFRVDDVGFRIARSVTR